MKRALPGLIVAGAIALSLPALLGFARFSMAQSPHTTMQLAQRPSRPVSPPPDRQPGAKKAPTCPPTTTQLAALVRDWQQLAPLDPWGSSHWEKTVSDRPTLWVYMPYQRLDDLDASVILQDETGNQYLTTWTLRLPEQAGVMAISFPKGVALEVGKRYRWLVSVACKEAVVVGGSIERVALAIAPQTKALTSPEQQLAFYTQNGLWYDAFTALASLYQANPSAHKAKWERLMQEINLPEIAPAQIVSTPPSGG
jgi:hypothetical protein